MCGDAYIICTNNIGSNNKKYINPLIPRAVHSYASVQYLMEFAGDLFFNGFFVGRFADHRYIMFLSMQNPQLNDFVRPSPPFHHRHGTPARPPLARHIGIRIHFTTKRVFIISVALSAHRPFCNNTYNDNPQTAPPLAPRRGRTRRRIPCRVDV